MVLLSDSRFAGKNWETARREVTALGLVVHDDRRPQARVAYGTVVAVRPHGWVPAGSEMWIVISRGPG